MAAVGNSLRIGTVLHPISEASQNPFGVRRNVVCILGLDAGVRRNVVSYFIWRGAKAGKSYRSWNLQQNEELLRKIGFDTAENGHILVFFKVVSCCCRFCILWQPGNRAPVRPVLLSIATSLVANFRDFLATVLLP